MLKVIVTGAGGDVASGVIDCLLAADIKTDIYLVGSNKYASSMYSTVKSFIVPTVKDPEYITKLIQIILDHEIDVLIPTIDSEISLISHNKSFIENNSRCLVLVGNTESVDICSDKKLTIDFLKRNGFSFPKTELYNDIGLSNFLKTNNYPFILKNRFGNASKEVYLINRESELYQFDFNNNFILQEYLDPTSGEYTTGIYTDKSGLTIGSCTLRRTLVNGSTQIAEIVQDPENEQNLNQIAIKLGLPYLNVQSIKVNGKLIPFEFNGRFSGTTGIIRKVFNGPELQIKEYFLNESLVCLEKRDNFIAIKYNNFMYIDETMVFELENRSRKYQ